MPVSDYVLIEVLQSALPGVIAMVCTQKTTKRQTSLAISYEQGGFRKKSFSKDLSGALAASSSHLSCALKTEFAFPKWY